MKRLALFVSALVTLALGGGPSGVHAAVVSSRDVTVQFSSGPTWLSMGLGHAQNVCLNESSPPNCPVGATLYGYGGSGWLADLSSIPGATWIWVPYITGAVAPAESSEFLFAKSFSIPGTPTAGTVSVAVDDLAIITVNGTVLGEWGSITDRDKASIAANNLKSFDITPYLVSGVNVVKIQGFNGPIWFAGNCPGHCTYALNPAGVVFGGSITYSTG